MILNRVLYDLLICLLLTVAVEAAAALGAGVRSCRGQVIVLLTNLITNPLLNGILVAVSFLLSPSLYYCFLIPLEIIIVILEGWIYKKTLSLKMNPFVFSLLLNVCSLLIGTGILKILNRIG